jgi:hypothetical protein
MKQPKFMIVITSFIALIAVFLLGGCEKKNVCPVCGAPPNRSKAQDYGTAFGCPNEHTWSAKNLSHYDD